MNAVPAVAARPGTGLDGGQRGLGRREALAKVQANRLGELRACTRKVA